MWHRYALLSGELIPPNVCFGTTPSSHHSAPLKLVARWSQDERHVGTAESLLLPQLTPDQIKWQKSTLGHGSKLGSWWAETTPADLSHVNNKHLLLYATTFLRLFVIQWKLTDTPFFQNSLGFPVSNPSFESGKKNKAIHLVIIYWVPTMVPPTPVFSTSDTRLP